LIIFYLLKKAPLSPPSFVSVGCYSSGPSDAIFSFNDSMTSAQCTSAANSNSLTCYGPSNGYYYLDATTMTIEKCAKICIQTYGFKYAGLHL
jgi:hypothetical protein